MHAERCQSVLMCIFADESVRKGLGVAQQFSEIVGVPPHGVLLLLKNGPGAHVKNNRYKYQTALNKEIARIEHIQQLRAQMLGLVGVLLTSAFIGIATLFSRIFYSYLGYHYSGSPLFSSASS